jgi:hypothetical protein
MQVQEKSRVDIHDWERSLGSADLDSLVDTANSLHRTLGLRLRQTALDIWCIGRILTREKELVGHGNWMDHCKRFHPEISLDSIERYIRVGEISIDQLPAIVEKTPNQAYVMLGLVKKRTSLPTHPIEHDNSSFVRNLKGSWKVALFKCPRCNVTIEFSRKGNYWQARASTKTVE